MTKKSRKNEPDRAHRVTLAELAAHDDACSDALIDNAYYRAQIRKNKPKYNPLRGIKEDEIPQILLHKVIVAKDVVAAEKALLNVSGLKRYRAGLKGKAVQDNFLRHLRKYIFTYMTDCPWEVSTTNRYTITTFEAAVTARARIKEHETIPYLVGTLVKLTADESNQLDATNRNFSIVCAGRKKAQSIFLGPARFANHDCDANARLVPKGDDSMEVVALKNIDVGQEITVSYGADYFGPKNLDCLCGTCETLGRNGWSVSGTPENSSALSSRQSSRVSSPEKTIAKRKRDSEDPTAGPRLQLAMKRQKLVLSPSKLQYSWTPSVTSESTGDALDTASSILLNGDRNSGDDTARELALSPPTSLEYLDEQETVNQESTADNVQHDRSISHTSVPDQQKIGVMTSIHTETHVDEPALPSPLSTVSSVVQRIHWNQSEEEVDDDTIVVKLESTEVRRIERDDLPATVNGTTLTPAPLNNLRTPASAEPCTMTTVTTTNLTSEMLLVPTEANAVAAVIESIESIPIQSVSSTTIVIQPISTFQRVPGDWFLTKKLLAQPHDRWVQCHNERCLGYFLQHNGYQTRRECPRCERHSMLYGFSWPKTDPNHRKILERPGNNKTKRDPNLYSAFRRQGKQGKGSWVEGVGDEEERTMDHRTIHRYVLPEDEKIMTRRGLLKKAEDQRQKGEESLISIFGLGRELTGRVTDTEIVERESLTPDGEIRRRSGRIIRDRIYTDI